MADELETFAINEDQWRDVNAALLASIGICGVHAPTMRDQMIAASIIMDDLVDASEEAEFAALKPFSTYPEDRDKMLALCAAVEKSCDDEAAIELADLVKSILQDEAA